MVPPTTVRLTPLRLAGSERLPIGRQLETNPLRRASQPTATMTVHLTRTAPPGVARRLRNGRRWLPCCASIKRWCVPYAWKLLSGKKTAVIAAVFH